MPYCPEGVEPFSHLPIGATFEFYRPGLMANAGFEPGPWVKTGAKTYEKAPYVSRPMKCTVDHKRVQVIAIVRDA